MIEISFEWPVGEQVAVRQALRVMTDKGIKDMVPVFDRFRLTLRRRHRKTFDAMADPYTGAPWTKLTPEYAKTKPKAVRDRILMLTGQMRKAVTVLGAPWSLYKATAQTMRWGMEPSEIYPKFHQTTRKLRKDGQKRQRVWLGMKLPEDLVELSKLIKTHIIGAWAKGAQKR